MRATIGFVSLSVLLLSLGCTEERSRFRHPLGPTALLPDPPPPEPLRIELVSGNGQQGAVGEPLAEPLVVRVTDGQGRAAEGRPVGFEITSGAGAFDEDCTDGGVVGYTTVDSDGLAQITFLPMQLGESVIVGRVVGGAVMFSARASTTMVWFLDAWVEPSFHGPCFTSGDVTVPRGTAVEWQSSSWASDGVSYTVTSMSAPRGGRSFDSGVLRAGDRFRFVPNVSGTWEYRDKVSGATGRLVAVPG